MPGRLRWTAKNNSGSALALRCHGKFSMLSPKHSIGTECWKSLHVLVHT